MLILKNARRTIPPSAHMRGALFLLASSLGLAVSSAASVADSEHFVGKYACAATPFWMEFEIVRAGNGFAARQPDGAKFADFAAVDGAMISKGRDGEEMSLQYDRATGAYRLVGTTEVSTFTGNQKVRRERAVTKVKPMPGRELEAQLGVTATALVKRVRDSEQWMHQFSTLRFTAQIAWTRTLAGIEYRKREIQTQYPDADLRRELFWGLAPREEGDKEVCLDRQRYRVSENFRDKSDEVLAWDGQAFVAYTKFHGRPDGECLIDPKLGDHGKTLLADLAWPKSQRHEFWWEGEVQDKAAVNDWFGRAEDFVLTGMQPYRGTRCYVLECRPKPHLPVHRWYVGVEDGRLRGLLTLDDGELAWEKWMDRYQEVKPGWWFPSVHGFHLIHNSGTLGGEDAATKFVAARYDLRVESIAVDQPLADDQFQVAFREGMKVHDLRFGGMVTYRYRKDMSPQEWAKVRDEAVRRAESDADIQRALNARIGQAAPAFPENCQWLNSPPLTWSDLRGKAVVLQFWSRRCGPCHEYIRLLKASGDKADVLVIGVHTLNDRTEAVKDLLQEHQANGPVCVDAPDQPAEGFGPLSRWSGIRALPSWCVVSPDGKVAGHFLRPAEAFQAARKTLSARAK